MRIASFFTVLILGALYVSSYKSIKEYEVDPFYVIDPLIMPYVLEYESYLMDAGLGVVMDNKSFSVIIGRLPKNVAGMAIGMHNDHAVNVVINIKEWGGLSDNQKRFLVFHELSHDVFNVEHDSCVLMVRGMDRMPSNIEWDVIMDELIQVIKCNLE